jgi:TolB-like protein/Tfp pilus assembly protein PilF
VTRQQRQAVRRSETTAGTALLCFLAACPPVFAQCPDGTPPPCGRPNVAAAPTANSVALMLFTNVSGDSGSAYLSDGLASEIATSLARVPRLDVTSPGAVRAAQRATAGDPRALGRRLNVRYVVEGDYQRGGERIRVSVRLVTVASGTQRWAESYTRPAADLLTVQEDIARNVATAIAGQLLPQERTVLAARPTRSPEAYDRFLRGNFFLARRTPAGVMRAIEEYGAAARLDPAFAQASARVALGYALFLDWGWSFPGLAADTLLARGLRAADLALHLDSASSDGWMARGYLLAFLHPRTLDGVLEALQRATALDPRNAEAWHQYGSWLTGVGRFDEALAAMERARAIEPGRAVTWLQQGQVYEIMRRDGPALQHYDSAISADPEWYGAYFFRTWVHLRAGNLAAARADAEATMRYSPATEEYYGLGALAAVAAHGGDSASARAYMARAVAPYATGRPGPIVAQALATGLTAAGLFTVAIEVLERSQPQGALLWWNGLYPALDPLWRIPRFRRLMDEARPPGAVPIR